MCTTAVMFCVHSTSYLTDIRAVCLHEGFKKFDMCACVCVHVITDRISIPSSLSESLS
jgi:hypothetical protein